MFWGKKRLKKKADKVVASIEDGVLQACINFGKSRLTKEEMPVYIASLNRSLAMGGMNMKTAIENALAEAKAGRDDVLEEQGEGRAREEFD